MSEPEQDELEEGDLTEPMSPYRTYMEAAEDVLHRQAHDDDISAHSAASAPAILASAPSNTSG